jgi:hypothetical protein
MARSMNRASRPPWLPGQAATGGAASPPDAKPRPCCGLWREGTWRSSPANSAPPPPASRRARRREAPTMQARPVRGVQRRGLGRAYPLGRPGTPRPLRCRRGHRPGRTPRPRLPVPGPRLPERAGLPGHPVLTQLRPPGRRQRVRRTPHPHAQGKPPLGAALPHRRGTTPRPARIPTPVQPGVADRTTRLSNPPWRSPSPSPLARRPPHNHHQSPAQQTSGGSGPLNCLKRTATLGILVVSPSAQLGKPRDPPRTRQLPPSSSGPGHRILSPKTGVRLP